MKLQDRPVSSKLQRQAPSSKLQIFGTDRGTNMTFPTRLNWCETKNIIIFMNFVRYRVWLLKSDTLKKKLQNSIFCFFLKIFVFYEQVADCLTDNVNKNYCTFQNYFFLMQILFEFLQKNHVYYDKCGWKYILLVMLLSYP